MNIAIIVKSLKYGGMEKAACNQSDAFCQSGNNVDLIYFSNKNNVLSPLEKKVNLIHIDLDKLMKKNFSGEIINIFAKIMNMIFRKSYPLIKGYYTSNIFEKEFKKLDKVNKYDLILIRGQGTYEQIWKFKDIRTVRICVNVSKKNYSSLLDKIMSKCYYNNVRVNCNSEGSKDFYVEKFKRENIKPISLDSIKNPFYKDIVSELSTKSNDGLSIGKYILGVGRLVKTKNFELLIDSYYNLKKNYNTSLKLVLVGDGDDKTFLENKCKKYGIIEDVIFTGYQSNPFPWIKNSELIVFTSKIEGLSNVLIEAMCCKTRILVTETPGGMLEMMKGTLSDNICKKDKNDIVKKINFILEKDKDYYYDDYKTVLEQFEPKIVVNQWLNLYCSNMKS